MVAKKAAATVEDVLVDQAASEEEIIAALKLLEAEGDGLDIQLRAANDSLDSLLISGTDSQVEEATNVLAKCQLICRRRNLRVKTLKERLEKVVKVRREAELDALDNEAQKASDEATFLLETEYPKHARAISDILMRVARSNSKIINANAAMRAAGRRYSIATAEQRARGTVDPRQSNEYGSLFDRVRLPGLSYATGGFYWPVARFDNR